ncbi:hypothetical protein K2173_015089 [Erythroxylum novogranatense]|uniref:HSF-type DNA-binding domain-containing protein n=1 Tax=Erythroxylum novogranatense TaxID=1862640 RepID=A0AAV8T0Y6_9ROSI|nr:hypothetical protein K2173_015089 [Erythroxylum novogranatense]
MVKSNDNGSLSIPPFLKKCYEMVDDESTNSIISWGQSNDTFVIWDMTEFSVQLLPKYFKHSNSSSFIRQLNIYGFKKVDTDRWEFANDGFVRGQKHLLKNIYRRKNALGTDNRKPLQQQDNHVDPSEKLENAGLRMEVETLKIDKNALMQELVKLRHNQETAHSKLVLLRDRLQGMEKSQQQMLSFLVMVMQSPGILAQLLHSNENNWRMAEPGSIVEQVPDDAEPLYSDGMIVTYQPPMDQLPEPIHVPPTGSGKSEDSSTSLDAKKDFVISPDFIKVFMEENFCSSENHGPFVLPELPDDGAWEQLLLSSPFSENDEDTKQDCEEPTAGAIKMGTTVSDTQLDRFDSFKMLVEELENSQNMEIRSADHRSSENLDILTKQMDLLISETNQIHEDQGKSN